MSPAAPRVVVIGGGISGLAAAFQILRRDAAGAIDLRVLEAAGRPGGKIFTEEAGGVLHETGPNGWLDSAPSTGALVRHLGLENALIRADAAAARRYIVRRGALAELPASAGAFLRSPILGPRAKLRLLAEPLVPRRDPAAGEESLADFGRRRLGADAVAWLLDPFVTGIHAGDPERISVQAAFPRIAALERDHGSLVRGMVARARRRRSAAGPRAGPAGPGGTLTSLEGGLRTLIEGLVELLGERVMLNAPVESIEAGSSGGRFRLRWAGGECEAEQVLLAIPAPAAAGLLRPHAPRAAAAAAAIEYAPLAVVETLFERRSLACELSGFGFLCPALERRRILGSLWTSSIFPGKRAPADAILLRTLVGGRRQGALAALPAAELKRLVLDELGAILPLRGAPRRSFISRWEQAIPQYEIGHVERVAALDGDLPPGLHVIGNAFRGIGINDCTAAAEAAAEKIYRATTDRTTGTT